MISNSGGVTNFCLSVMQSSFGFTDVESIKIPATGFVDNLGFLRAVETIFVRKEKLDSASVLKNNLKVDEAIRPIDTRF